jgi:hypothetical protein
MARYKHIDTSPRFLAVDLERQLLPGTFEHALNYLIDHEIDLSGFDTRYKNDLTGAAAYPPAMLLKITLFAYSRGMVSSRNRTTGSDTIFFDNRAGKRQARAGKSNDRAATWPCARCGGARKLRSRRLPATGRPDRRAIDQSGRVVQLCVWSWSSFGRHQFLA